VAELRKGGGKRKEKGRSSFDFSYLRLAVTMPPGGNKGEACHQGREEKRRKGEKRRECQNTKSSALIRCRQATGEKKGAQWTTKAREKKKGRGEEKGGGETRRGDARYSSFVVSISRINFAQGKGKPQRGKYRVGRSRSSRKQKRGEGGGRKISVVLTTADDRTQLRCAEKGKKGEKQKKKFS